MINPDYSPPRRDHQPVIDRHMNHPDAVLLRARDALAGDVAFWTRQIRQTLIWRAGCVETAKRENRAWLIDWQARRRRALLNMRQYEALIAESAAMRGALEGRD